MLSPKLLEILRAWWRVESRKHWLFPGDMPGEHISRDAVEQACQKARRLSRFPSPSRRIRFATHSPFIYWNPEQTSAPFNCCSAIAAWRPPPAICASHQQGVLDLQPAGSAAAPCPADPKPTPPQLLLSRRAMDRPKLEVADIFRRYGEAYREQHGASMSTAQRRVMTAIEVCRTAALGGHIEQCDSAVTSVTATISAEIAIVPSVSRWPAQSGSNTAKRKFSTARTSTSSSQCRRRLPRSPTRTRSWSTTFSSKPRPKPCAPSPPIPNTWAPRSASSPCCTLGDESRCIIPHLHCVVPGGGLSPDGTRWVPCRPRFFLPVRVLSCLFRRLFWTYLQKAFDAGKLRSSPPWRPFGIRRLSAVISIRCENVKWVVYAKRALRRPATGARLRRPLHPSCRDLQQSVAGHRRRPGRSNGRTIATTIKQKTMTLSAEEFIRRFLLHVLPEWVPPHSLLRLPGQSLPERETGPLPPTPGHDSSQLKLFPTPARRGLPGTLQKYRSLSTGMPGLSSWPDDCGPVIAQSSFSPGHPRSLWLIPCDSKSSSPQTRYHRVEGIVLLHKHSESTVPVTISHLVLLALPEAP